MTDANIDIELLESRSKLPREVNQCIDKLGTKGITGVVQAELAGMVAVDADNVQQLEELAHILKKGGQPSPELAEKLTKLRNLYLTESAQDRKMVNGDLRVTNADFASNNSLVAALRKNPVLASQIDTILSAAQGNCGLPKPDAPAPQEAVVSPSNPYGALPKHFEAAPAYSGGQSFTR